VSRTDAFETPLGPITAARELAETLARDLDLGPDPADDPRSSGDNTVEVQLPFIKHLWPDVQLLVLAPPAAAEAVDIGRRTIELAQQIHKPLAVVGSTDLTHYGPRFGFTPHGTGPEAFAWAKNENDARLIDRILAGDAPGVLSEAEAHHNACVPGAAAAALTGAYQLGARQARLLAYGSSYDIQPGSTFVGYAGITFQRESP
jgi:AmmeMemoRadiSam system protein B